jgi:hypothetical protein
MIALGSCSNPTPCLKKNMCEIPNTLRQWTTEWQINARNECDVMSEGNLSKQVKNCVQKTSRLNVDRRNRHDTLQCHPFDPNTPQQTGCKSSSYHHEHCIPIPLHSPTAPHNASFFTCPSLHPLTHIVANQYWPAGQEELNNWQMQRD